MATTTPIASVGVVGAGLIGKSWALVFARAGVPVVLYDSVPTALEGARGDVRAKAEQLAREGLLRGCSAAEVVSRVRFTADLADLARSVQYVQECVPETLELKTRVFQELDALVSEGTVLASSTSNLCPSQFLTRLKHHAHALVAHPINPPHLIPAVELVPSPLTAASTVERVRAFLRQVGQSPVLLHKEIDGFVVNRLQYGVLGEAFRLIQDGVIDPADLDLAISDGLGLRWSFMGPFQTIDLNAVGGVQDYCDRFAQPIATVMRQMDNSRYCFSPDVVHRIHAAMRAAVPLDQLKARERWRDARLIRLSLHKQQEAALDQSTAASSTTKGSGPSTAAVAYSELVPVQSAAAKATAAPLVVATASTSTSDFLSSLFGLRGQVAVVTGGTGVLGSAMSVALAKAGAKVVLIGRSREKADAVAAAIAAAGGDALVVLADVLQLPAVQAAARTVMEKWGRVDILVNAAGGNVPAATLAPEQTIFELPESALRQVFDLNFYGTVLPTQVFGPLMAAQATGGSIVNISSMAAMRATTRVAGYSAAKAAVDNYTRYCAVDLARKYGTRMRVNAIAPGFFVTEQNRKVLVQPDGTLTARGNTIVGHTPAGRFGEADELVSTLIWLVAPASRFVTGTVVPVDGGFSAFSGV